MPFLMIALSNEKEYPGVFARNLYHSGIATFTVGSIVRGVLDIYGTANHLLNLYWITGTALTLLGGIVSLLQNKDKNGTYFD